jgi:hypothetical protein
MDRAPTVPSTNSGIESVNSGIKKLTDRKRLPIPKCIQKLKQIVSHWALDGKPYRNEVLPSERMRVRGKRLGRLCNEKQEYEMVPGNENQ